MTSPGDRPDLPLEEEPLPFLHPADAGTARPVHDVGDRDGLLLEEEPAEWIAFVAEPRPPLRGGDRPAPGPADPDGAGGTDRPLPATGSGAPTGLAVASVAAAWLLRRRGHEDPNEA